MGPIQSVRVALSCLAANKLRSSLTMIGVIIGVGSVIVMVSIIEGARAKATEEFEHMGSRLVLVSFTPEKGENGNNRAGVEHLTLEDAEAIGRECPLVTAVSPEFTMWDREFASGGETFEGGVVGCLPPYARIHDVKVASGRFLSDEECEDWEKVCVVGATVADKLWPEEDPLGQSLRVHGIDFTVVGVAEPKGRVGWRSPDKNIYAPITTVQKRIAGNRWIWHIGAEVAAVEDAEAAADQIWELLMERHRNQPDYTVDTQGRILAAIDKILNLFSAVLGAVGGLALLVGGIGIMNIMLVSVTERTREIGLRKALGAKRKHVSLQFLTESMTLSGIGGLLGIAAGVGLSCAVGAVMREDLPTHTPVWVAVLAFSFACGVGVFFGLYPAWRAAKLDPIQALRHE